MLSVGERGSRWPLSNNKSDKFWEMIYLEFAKALSSGFKMMCRLDMKGLQGNRGGGRNGVAVLIHKVDYCCGSKQNWYKLM
jgi:hypothetical protein